MADGGRRTTEAGTANADVMAAWLGFRRILYGIALSLCVCVAVSGAPGAARPPSASRADPAAAAIRTIDRAQGSVAAVAAEAREVSGPIETGRLIRRADGAKSEAQRAIVMLASELADGHLADPQRAAMVAQIARGGRVATAAANLARATRDSPGRRVERTLAMRTGSPLSARFWRAAAEALPGDVDRLLRFLSAQADATWRGVGIGRSWPAAVGLVAALLLLFPVRLRLRRTGQRLMINRVPQSRLRRSGWAVWIAVLGVAIPWLAILALYAGFEAADMVSAPWQPFAIGIIRGVAVAAATWSVASALLQRDQASWRLPPIGDAAANGISPWTLAAAIAVFVTVVIDELLAAAATGPGLRDAAMVAETLLGTAINVGLLATIGRARRRADMQADDAAKRAVLGGDLGERPARRGLVAVALAVLLGWMTVAATFVALAVGHLALALMIARMLVWLPLVAAAVYLIWLVIDDLATEVISGGSAFGGSLHRAFGVRASVVDQVGVSLSAVLRILTLLLGGIAAFAPFGSNLDQLGALAGVVGRGVTIGEFTIAPGAILRALIVLMIGLVVVRTAEHWLVERYLPKTELDAGARNSISTVARYLGFLLAAAWAFGALGIGFERVALLLSALSVGIGFGLQAITQNFISGLILLIERPIKIGDLVEVGGQKGDVKRISVRATEIEIADRSTLIVPNSELITKTVRNMTHANPMGIVQLKFTVPLDTDVEAVRHLILSLFAEADAVFDTPEPKVFIDSIRDGAAHFDCTAYCHSPREAYATRSDVLFRLIMESHARGIGIGSPAAVATGTATPVSVVSVGSAP